ncbi:MAG: hypothetical protein L6Q84_09090 [Polyangiaceae bacterium]|nr:hypothetical protein [Polyangiaceae bacterium]
MASASIELDQDGVIRGEPLSGRLHVRAERSESHTVSVEVQSLIHGKARSLFVYAEEALYQGPLSAGETRTFPFSIRPPLQIPSHRGRLFTIEPRLAAVVRTPGSEPRGAGVQVVQQWLRATTPAELHARASPAAAVALRRVEPGGARRVTLKPGPPLDASEARTGVVVALVVLALGVVAGGLTVAVGGGWLGPNPWIALVPAMFAAVLGLAGLWALQLNARRWAASAKIGVPRVATECRTHAGAEVLDVRVALASRAAQLRGMAHLRVIERVTRDAGSTTLVDESVVFASSAPLHPLGPGEYGAALSMPPDPEVSLSFDMKKAEIEWQLGLGFALPVWPDWERTLVLDAARVGVTRETATVKVWELA